MKSGFESAHQAVLCSEILSFLTGGLPSNESLNGGTPKIFVDGTVGEGGHTAALLEASAPDGIVIAFDRDPEAIERVRERLGSHNERVILVNESYENLSVRLPNILSGIDARRKHAHPLKASGLLLDLGLSSRQLSLAERGFSFQKEGPLDMRFNQNEKMTAGDIVNYWPENKLRALFEENDETWGKKIASAIVAERRKNPIQSTTDLAQLIRRCIPSKFHS
ncbi:MAG: 16S rRNA (cytosine(1402)-N(4))-methyltransferase, partial [bacterium]|nr:16S rRNA (cytosine(1402)-N(4))-methyltransferase [bacterium]